MNSLRIGCVKYLNARPLIHGWKGEVLLDHPSALCARLARGDLDVALVSSFEFLRNPIYWIVDCVSISSDGPVYSVVVAHQGEISDIEEIELDPAAETSGNLLRCLLGELNLDPRLLSWHRRPADDLRKHRQDADATMARLLIGDQAIRFRQKYENEFRFFDLGENWKKLTGLPFVYALWLIRPEVVDPKSIADELRALRDKNLSAIENVIGDQQEFDPAFCDRYFCKHLRFNFEEREKKGLEAFAKLCQKHALLPKRKVAFSVV